LEDFLFDIKKGKMVIYATDLENSMSTQLDIESKEDGRIAIPAKILIDTLKTLPEATAYLFFRRKNFCRRINQ
jgi:DNA polymerase-3 subunit beta